MSRPAVERLFFWISALPTLFVLAACLQRDSFLPTTIPERARMLASDREFEFIGWTVDALWWKTAQFTLGEERYLSPAAWHSQVIRYNALIDSIHRNEDELKRIFADPAVADPMAATAELRTRIAEARSQQSQRQARIESILEQEVASEIRRQGFSFGGEVFPPVLFHFTPLPKMLILSPRDTIRQEATVQLVPDFTLEEEIALERKEEARLGVSALVVPLGGLGTFPTMIMENTWTNWVLEAISHEWVHNYLAFTPLGLNYETSGEMRTINETAASIAGKRLGAGILARFYRNCSPRPPPGRTATRRWFQRLTSRPPSISTVKCTRRAWKPTGCWRREKSPKRRRTWRRAGMSSWTTAMPSGA